MHTKLFPKELSQVNTSPILTGLSKTEYNYWQKLLRYAAPVPSGPKGSTSSPLVDGGNYSLGKRLVVLTDDDIPSTPQTLTHKVEFTKEFLSSAKSQSGPNILKVGIDDYYSKITVVETNYLFQLFLLGTTDGSIKCIFMRKNEEENKADNEVIKEERSRREKEIADINASANTIEPIINEEFFFNLSSTDFNGHCSVITAISLKYNCTRFVSGSLDGEIRLWDIPMQMCLMVVKAHFESVLTLKMAPKDDLFVTAGSEQILSLWHENSSILFLTKINNSKVLQAI